MTNHLGEMNSTSRVTLGEISEQVNYGYTASATDEPIGPKFLRITDIQSASINWGATPYCSIPIRDKEKYALEKGDIVVARTGNSTGSNMIIKDDVDSVFASYLIRFKIDKGKADPRYVYYCMQTPYWDSFINGAAAGSAQKGTNAEVLKGFEFQALPSLPEQKRIASILSSFDDKIELLRKQNQTLENIAQTIFKRWFVEFNFPDENGKPYKENGGKMVESELGELPEGWEVNRLTDIAEFTNGLPMQKYRPMGDDKEFLPVIKIRELKSGYSGDTEKASLNIEDKFIVHTGDILFSWSGSLELKIWDLTSGALNQHLFKVTSQEYPKWFYYFWIKHYLREFRQIAASKATTMGHIQRKHLDLSLVPTPKKDFLSRLKFDYLEKVSSNNLSLASLGISKSRILNKLFD